VSWERVMIMQDLIWEYEETKFDTVIVDKFIKNFAFSLMLFRKTVPHEIGVMVN
jgi:hypothetical protein